MKSNSATIIAFPVRSPEKSGQDDATKHKRVRGTRQAKKGSKPLPGMGQDNAMSRIYYPICGPSSRQPDPPGGSATPVQREAFHALVDRTGRNELARQLPAEWKAFRGMMERRRIGIATVDRRFATFKLFLKSMGPCPTPEHRTVDRIDSYDPCYAPGKVRWATSAEQANNRCRTPFLNFQGRKMPLTVVARETGQKPDTLRARLRRGWTEEEAIAGKRMTSVSTPIVPGEDVAVRFGALLALLKPSGCGGQ